MMLGLFLPLAMFCGGPSTQDDVFARLSAIPEVHQWAQSVRVRSLGAARGVILIESKGPLWRVALREDPPGRAGASSWLEVNGLTGRIRVWNFTRDAFEEVAAWQERRRSLR